jgi:hypothetical protein
MADNKNQQVIVAFFDNKNGADTAISDLQAWDKASDEVKLGAIGTLTKENGKVKTNVGRKTGKGATVGTVIGVIAAILSGGITLIGGVLVGGATGGVVGAFMKKSTNLTKAEIEQIGKELDAGRVAVVVTCDDHEVAPTRQRLISSGGTVRNYTVPQEAFTEAAKAVPGADTAAIEQAPAEVVTEALAEASDMESASAEVTKDEPQAG